MIELRDISKNYRMGNVDISALIGVTLSVRQGELIAIMGRVRQVHPHERPGVPRPPDQRQFSLRIA
jgi:hypothetical protein